MSKRNFLLILSCAAIISCYSINAYGESVNEMHDSAYELMINGEFIEAIKTYTTILEIEESDETALLNRAFAFAKIGDTESSLVDFSLVLEKDSKNLTALNGISTLLANTECESYENCGPLQSLQILERMIDIDPENEEIRIKRNFMFTQGYDSIPNFAMFDVKETNGDYIVNIQQIVRDRDGNLVSVIENAGTDISPTMLTEKYLDSREKNSVNFEKEVVEIGDEKYIKWHYEILTSNSEIERKFFGLSKSGITVSDGERDGKKMFMKIDLISALFPAVNVDVGDETRKIVEVFKKI